MKSLGRLAAEILEGVGRARPQRIECTMPVLARPLRNGNDARLRPLRAQGTHGLPAWPKLGPPGSASPRARPERAGKRDRGGAPDGGRYISAAAAVSPSGGP